MKPIHLFEFEGELLSIPQLSELSDIDPGKLYNRLVKLKWPIEEALGLVERPNQPYKRKNVPSAATVKCSLRKQEKRVLGLMRTFNGALRVIAG